MVDANFIFSLFNGQDKLFSFLQYLVCAFQLIYRGPHPVSFFEKNQVTF